MRIGLDIDNVVSDFDKYVMEQFLIEDKNKRNKGIVNPLGDWVGACFDWTHDEIEDFLEHNMQEFALKMEPRENAKYYMDKLLEDGHELILISHRAFPHYTKPLEVTKEWLKENKINYTQLILSQTTNKSKECIDNKIDIMFDDVQANCHQLKDGGVNIYLMATEHNHDFREGLKVVNDWQELYEVVSKSDIK